MKTIIKIQRTPEEIKAAIEKLQSQRTTLPEFSYFGDPNWKIIDAQIAVLEGKIKTDDEIYDMAEELQGEENIGPVLDASIWVQGDDSDFLEE